MNKGYLKRSWINPMLVSGKSKIHGEGVFTKEKISKGEKLMEFGGENISRDKVFSGDYRSRSIWTVDKDTFLALSISDAEESLDEHLNHSCDPNSWLEDEVTLVARRDIEPGEEITLDQGTWNFEYKDYTDNQEMCHCGADICRHVLTENDWKITEIQERYQGHFHPIIQAKLLDRSI